jgi:hypothetical protein
MQVGLIALAGIIEHPDTRYLAYLVHVDGTLTGAKPRLRHNPDCSHLVARM